MGREREMKDKKQTYKCRNGIIYRILFKIISRRTYFKRYKTGGETFGKMK
jgi:hypothetical protein